MKQTLKLARETWESLTPQQQQEQREKFDVVVAKHYYASGPVDLDTPIELAMVPRVEVQPC